MLFWSKTICKVTSKIYLLIFLCLFSFFVFFQRRNSKNRGGKQSILSYKGPRHIDGGREKPEQAWGFFSQCLPNVHNVKNLPLVQGKEHVRGWNAFFWSVCLSIGTHWQSLTSKKIMSHPQPEKLQQRCSRWFHCSVVEVA